MCPVSMVFDRPFFSHVLYAFIRKFCRKLKVGKATVVCYFVLWIVASSILPDHILAFYKVKWLFPFLIFGGIAANIKKAFRAEKRQVFAGTVVFILASVFLYEEKMAKVYSEFLYTNLPEIAIGVVYYAISSLGIWCLYEWSGYIAKIDRLKEKMCMVGRRSIDIYVAHMLVIKFFFFIPRLIQQSKIMIVLYACIYAFIVVVCIAVVSDKYLKHIKVYNLAVGAKKESAGENIRMERRTLL
ncbi:MAG: acyltransferase [Lachnospiraceae bacterium]|nr:acyltransferase [Lachnospiraceae bacterium]